MSQAKKRLAVLTGGGDCPGLNAVIRAVVKTALNNGYEIFGIENGFNGLVTGRMGLMDYKDVSGILPRGGTILGTTNRDNPFKFAVEENGELVYYDKRAEIFGIENGFNGLVTGRMGLMDYKDVSGILPRGGTILGTTNRDNPFKFAVEENGELVYYDKRAEVLANLEKHGIEALVVIGGDGSLNIAARLAKECGIKVVGVPKTIDNDLPCTERTFGFDTAMAMATEALDRIHTTAESHHRVMALEVMGRYAGWIALHSGIAGGADVILIPEIPYSINSVIGKIRARQAAGKQFSIIVVAEGARPVGGEMSIARMVKGSFEPIRLGGAGEKLVREIEEKTGIESRCTVLGYLQRGGTPTPFDRVLSTRYGVAAAEACMRKEYNVMVSLQNDKIVTEPIEKVASEPRLVPVDSDIIRTGRQMGLCFGD